MSRIRTTFLGAALLATSIPPSPLAAQLQGDIEIAVASAYQWRGLMLTNRPLAFLDLGLAGGAGNLGVAAGASFSIEPHRYDGARDISLTADRPSPSIGDATLWAELSAERGALTITAGSAAFIYPAEHSLNLQEATLELYGLLQLDGTVSPSIGAYADVGQIGGLYLEAALATGLELPAAVQLELEGSAGLSVSQPDYYAQDGFTHAELSAGLLREWGSVWVRPALAVSALLDPATRIVAPLREERSHIRLELAVGWSTGEE